MDLFDNLMKVVVPVAAIGTKTADNLFRNSEDAPKVLLKTGSVSFTKGIAGAIGLRIMLTNIETKDIANVIRSLENRASLLEGTTRKISSQEGGFLNFPRPLMTTGLPLMKSVLTPLAKIF